MNKHGKFIWLADIVFVIVFAGAPLALYFGLPTKIPQYGLVLIWAGATWLYFKFRMRFDRTLMKYVTLVVFIVALGMLALIYGNAAWDFLAVRIGWFPTILVFLAVIAVFAVALWIM